MKNDHENIISQRLNIEENKMMKVDYNELHEILKNDEMCKVAIGFGKGKDKVQSALNQIRCFDDLCETSRALVVIRAGSDLKLDQTQKLLDELKVLLSYCELKVGVDIVDKLDDEVEVIVAATSYNYAKETEEIYEHLQLFTL